MLPISRATLAKENFTFQREEAEPVCFAICWWHHQTEKTEDNEEVIHCGQPHPPFPTHSGWTLESVLEELETTLFTEEKPQEILLAKSRQPPTLTGYVTDHNLDFF